MYSISDAEYLRDFTMMLNDDIIDCFTTKVVTEEQKKEIEKVAAEIKKAPFFFEKTVDGAKPR